MLMLTGGCGLTSAPSGATEVKALDCKKAATGSSLAARVAA